MAEPTREAASEAAFTSVQLMIVVAILSILLMLVIPTALGARGQAEDASAKSDLKWAIQVGRMAYTTPYGFTTVNLAQIRAEEPAISWVDSETESHESNARAISFRVDPIGELNMATLSEAGDCYYIRSIDSRGPDLNDVPGTYFGHADLASCRAATIDSYATTDEHFSGW